MKDSREETMTRRVARAVASGGADHRRLAEVAGAEGMHWGNAVADTYFRNAEMDIERDWANIIAPIIGGVAYDVVIDIAAGRGRNAVRLAERGRQVICVDINPENVASMQARFQGDDRFIVRLTDGTRLNGIREASADLVYSFDSMVHFDMEIVASYLRESARVLRPGGHAFMHFSNYTDNPGGDFRQNPHWRNYMGIGLFTHLARRAGFSIVTMHPISWGGVANLDGVALLSRPLS